MISHHHKCIFIHIPKVAGQSIEHVFLDALGLTWETRAPLLLRPNDQPSLGPPRLAHLKAAEYVRCRYVPQDMYDSYFTFSFVCNPWSRMVSLYRYLGYEGKFEFNSFIKNEFRNIVFQEMSWFVCPQSEYLYNEAGELIVDYVGRFEDLQGGFDEVCENIGMAPILLPHVNASPAQTPAVTTQSQQVTYSFSIGGNEVPTARPSWRDYYDDGAINVIAELYRRDIELFGYQFR